MEAVYGVEGFPKLWLEPKKLKEPWQKFNEINQDKLYSSIADLVSTMQVSLVPCLCEDLGGGGRDL